MIKKGEAMTRKVTASENMLYYGKKEINPKVKFN
jgi:hypothetical protein